MENSAIEDATLNPSRRNFLLTAPVAAAAGLTLADTPLFAATAEGQAPPRPQACNCSPPPDLKDDIKALQAGARPTTPSWTDKNFVVILTVETAKSAKEFEYHEGRDHVFHILDGTTSILKWAEHRKARTAPGPGSGLRRNQKAPSRYTLNKGDMLVIPRDTPHKRITEGTVTLLLVSPMGAAKA